MKIERNWKITESSDGFDKAKFNAVIEKIKAEMPDVRISNADKYDTFIFTGTIHEVHKISGIFINLGVE